MKTSTKKEIILKHVNDLDSEQVTFLYDLLTTFRRPFINKQNICNLSELKNDNFDTALPCDYTDRIKDIYPNFKSWAHVYNYKNNIYGELHNICESLILNMHKVFSK